MAPPQLPAPTVSVLIPCRNAERYLADTLDSAVTQAGVSWEVIVVDDGSTDRSAEIAARYAPEVCVIAGPSRGVSAARNLATSRARGRYLQYLDADDLLAPGTLAARVEALDTSGADLVLGDWQRLVTDSDGTFVLGKVEAQGPEDFHAEFDLAVFKGFWSPLAAILYRANLVRRVGGWREDFPVIEDARFLFDAAWAGARAVRLRGVAASYRQHASGSLSSSDPARFWGNILRNTIQIEAMWKKAGRLQGDRRAAVGQGYADLARALFPLSEPLYVQALAALQHHPSARWSKYLWTAETLRLLVGHARARRWLAHCRKS